MMRIGHFMLFPPEYQIVEAEHIERGQTGNERHPYIPYDAVAEAGCQDFVFREESGKRNYTGYSQTPDKECNVCYRHILSKPVHGSVIVRTDCVYKRAGTKEKQSLEHGMCEQVEHTCHVTNPVMHLRTGNA